MKPDKRLNKEQLEAIKHQKGPLLIIAGAGTGKTTVLCERIKYLILGKLAKPEEILALTFTEKAAREMEERVDIAMPYGYTQMWISTFHSFCDRILRREALHIGLTPRYRLLTEAEAIQVIRTNLFKFKLNYFRPLGNPNKFISGILQHFSRLQDEDVSASQYLTWAKKQKPQGKTPEERKLEYQKALELAEAFKQYDTIKIKEGLMDFGDLIVKTLELFRRRKNILLQYQKQFKYLLVDEFQDTNFAQNELVKLLARKDRNITVVGDDDQAIYRFRGASVSNIVQFRKNFPKTKVVVLTKNYRSTQEILNRSYGLIQNNNPDRLEVIEKVNKKLVSQVAKDGEVVRFFHVDRVENEAERVAREIESLVKDGNYSYKDVAILVRANNHFEPFGRALSRRAIPYQFLGPGRLFKQLEVMDLIAYLKVLDDFSDSVSFYRLLSSDLIDLAGRDLAALGGLAKRKNKSLFEVCEKIDDLTISNESKDKISKLMIMLNKHLGLIKNQTAGQVLYYFLQDSGLLTKMMTPESVDAEKKALNVSKFFDKLKTYEVDHEDASVRTVVNWLDLSAELGESPLAVNEDWSEIDAVNILTVHSAKGLEFKVVFLVNLVGQRFPTTERREQIPIPEKLIKEVLPVGDYHLEEERRLFYVGMTRAKDLLYFSAADYYGEGKREKRLSPFVYEALGDKMLSAEVVKDNNQQLSFLDYSTTKDEPIKNGKHLPIHIDYLSVSQIETFKVCPLHYKLKYLLKVPALPSASQSFGITMHATMKAFYDLLLQNNKPSEKLIYECLKDNWISDGYQSKTHETKFFEKGKVYLSGYLKEGFDKKIMPTAMERMFIIPLRLKNNALLGGRFLKIGGKIDRVDVFPDGTMEIIDYKTGATIPSQKEVDGDMQLTFYALAASEIPTKPFGVSPDKIKLSLYFFDDQEKITTTRTKEQLEKTKEAIIKIRDEIETSDFTCSGSLLCRSCEYKLLCNTDFNG